VSTSVDVVVVTYNSATTIDALLDSLPAAAGEVGYRTVVVDNASVDTTREVVRGRGDALVVPAPNLGYAAGLNRGVAALDGSGPILMLNPDCVLAPGSLEQLVRAQEETGAGIVVPQIRGTDGVLARSIRREPSVLRSVGLGDSRWPSLSEVVNEDEAYEQRHRVEWATGAVLLVSRECYLAVDGLDESFFMYSEETDLCLRARAAGHETVFEPTAGAVHVGGASGQSPELYAVQALNRVRLYRRTHGIAPSLVFMSLATGRELVKALGGDADARRALSALTRPSARPAMLPWRGSVLRSSRPERRPDPDRVARAT
jgi:N-acetylglucosaminyl-diphospho-decaprenol L-rhamnosyltransferase